jgi:hypothetical protein
MTGTAILHSLAAVDPMPWTALHWQRPAMLLALPVVLLPLWFARSRSRERACVILPTAPLLDRLPARHRRRLAEPLLTAVRMAMLAMLVLAFAGPQWTDAADDASPNHQTGVAAPHLRWRHGGDHRILIVGQPGSLNAAELLERALIPLGEDAHPWRVHRLPPSALDAAALADADQLWLADMDTVPPDMLADFIAAGGSVLAFPGPRTTPDMLAASYWPLRIIAVRDDDAPWPQISPVPPPGSAISADLAAALAQTVVRPRHHAAAADGATVHLRLADGEAALIEQSFGRGRVAVLNLDLSISDADLSHTSDLARRGLFVWLVHTLAQHLQPAAGDPSPASPPTAPAAVEARHPMIPPVAVLLIMAWGAWVGERVLLAGRPGPSPASQGAT